MASMNKLIQTSHDADASVLILLTLCHAIVMFSIFGHHKQNP